MALMHTPHLQALVQRRSSSPLPGTPRNTGSQAEDRGAFPDAPDRAPRPSAPRRGGPEREGIAPAAAARP